MEFLRILSWTLFVVGGLIGTALVVGGMFDDLVEIVRASGRRKLPH